MASDMDLKAIGRRIRFQREQLHLTREVLAEKLEVSAKFCADIEYGMKGMSMTTLNRLSEILNLSTDYILKGNRDIRVEKAENHDIIESVVATLNSCNRIQLGRVEQLLRIFVATVSETAGEYEEA
ncbi:MAG TPA: helix-turn-helix transcriptional regulator [Anaerovoracaceae bacterium]|nr:helix-turn-helix transcriptional regulator [Anaerovoracaceae bacterium]